MAKINGAVASATTYYANTVPARAIDGSIQTRWESNNTGTAILNEIFVISFPKPVTLKQVRVQFMRWSRDLRIGYSHTGGTVKANYTEVKNINFNNELTDSVGKDWIWAGSGGNTGINEQNTILLPENDIASENWGFWMDEVVYPTSYGSGNVDRARIYEISLYDAVDDSGVNPKPPATVPVLPFSTTPSYWTRTEYATPGSFNFTPDTDTKLVLVVAQGAGAGGRVNLNLSGVTTPTDGIAGGDVIISTAKGEVLRAPGGESNIIADAISTAQGKVAEDWLQYVDSNSRAGAVTLIGSASGSAGGQAFLNSMPGTTFTLAAQNTNDGVLATQYLGGTAPLPFDVTYVNAERNASTSFGIRTINQNPTVSGETTIGSFEYGFRCYAGQTISITCTYFIPSSYGVGKVYFNGVENRTLSASSSQQTVTITLTAETDGIQTVKFEVTSISLTGTAPYIRNTALSVSGVGQGGASSGASGRLGQVYLLPSPLTIVVPKGGVGQAGGQAITASQNGSRGSGAGVGGNGGDGVVIVYEYKSFMNYEDASVNNWSSFNVLTEVSGFFRTQYVGVVDEIGGTKPFTHKMRPKTKTVVALIVGAGGINKGRTDSPTDQKSPTSLITKKQTFSAEAGWSANVYGNGGAGTGGIGGYFSPVEDAIYAGRGAQGGSLGNSGGNNNSIIAGYYGSGGSNYYLSTTGGGCGGYGVVVIPESDFNADRTLTMEVGNVVNSSATAGAVFLYETESVFGPNVSQLTELLLKKEPRADSAISQISELVLRKAEQSATVISQAPELILMKESDEVDLQVSHMNVAFVYTYDDPRTAISQASELLLMKQGPVGTQVSQSSELLFMKQDKLPTQVSQTTELIFSAELPSVFYMDFGTLEYPAKNQLYTSITKRATSVPDDAYIQLEGNLAPDSTIWVNGVNMGKSSPVKSSDQIYLVAGVTNYWQDKINVYSYSVVNGQVARNLVGVWKVLQPNLTPVKTRAYSRPAVYTWIKTIHNIALSVAPRVAAKAGANSTYGKFVEFLASKVQVNGYALGTKFVQAFASSFSMEVEKLATANHSEYFRQGDFLKPAAHSITVSNNGYSETKAHSDTSLKLVNYGVSRAEYGVETHEEFEQSFVGSEAYVRNDSILQKTHFEGIDIEGEGNHAGFGIKKQDYVLVNPNDPGVFGGAYTPIKFTRNFALFDNFAIPTIAYSTETKQVYATSVPAGVGLWIQPLAGAVRQIAAYGDYTGVNYVLVKTHPNVDAGFEGEAQHAPTLGYHTRAGGFKTTIGISTFQVNGIKRTQRRVLADIAAIFTTAKRVTVPLTPYRYEQTPNRIGKASLYKGFDTLSEIQAYTDTYSDVIISTKYNGYVYNLSVDQTFVCEIYFNGPVKWFMQGG